MNAAVIGPAKWSHSNLIVPNQAGRLSAIALLSLGASRGFAAMCRNDERGRRAWSFSRKTSILNSTRLTFIGRRGTTMCTACATGRLRAAMIHAVSCCMRDLQRRRPGKRTAARAHARDALFKEPGRCARSRGAWLDARTGRWDKRNTRLHGRSRCALRRLPRTRQRPHQAHAHTMKL